MVVKTAEGKERENEHKNFFGPLAVAAATTTEKLLITHMIHLYNNVVLVINVWNTTQGNFYKLLHLAYYQYYFVATIQK